jgi:hypothetical protein
MGPNFVLDKGFKCTGSTAYTRGEVVVISGDGQTATRATSAANLAGVLGVVMDTVDAEKVQTGKAQVAVRLLGIARCIAASSIAIGSRVGNTTAAKVDDITRAAAGAQPAHALGLAMTPATADGDHIDVLLTPGATY